MPGEKRRGQRDLPPTFSNTAVPPCCKLSDFDGGVEEDIIVAVELNLAKEKE